MYPYIKRALDVFLSLVGLMLFGWLLLLCAAAIKLEEPRAPVMYNRLRVGKNHRLFRMYKLRTMRQDCSGKRQLPGEANLSRAGRLIRSLSLDELPQLVNVLRGEMSMIGPRPLPPCYLGYFTRREDIRHGVRPGITGITQVNGRANLNWPERFELDAVYVERLSFWNDLRVFFSTILKVAARSDVLTEGSRVTQAFDMFRIEQLKNGLLKEGDVLLYTDAEAAAITELGSEL
ncbi:MAG TPA: sugar transferase [Feifaniaceae bacterium]|nr:sugar transferase [Feifaniaceae bacterium]